MSQHGAGCERLPHPGTIYLLSDIQHNSSLVLVAVTSPEKEVLSCHTRVPRICGKKKKGGCQRRT